MNTRKARWFMSAAATLLLFAPFASNAIPARQGDVDLLRRTLDRYRSITRYDARVSMGMAPPGSIEPTFAMEMRISGARPDRSRFELSLPGKSFVVAHRGDSTISYVTATRQYTVSYTSSLPESLWTGAGEPEDPLQAIFGAAFPWDYGLQEPYFECPPESVSVLAARPDTLYPAGHPAVACTVLDVSYSTKDGRDSTQLWIDPATATILREVQKHPDGATVTTFVEWHAGDEVSDDVFWFTPPDGARRVDDITDLFVAKSMRSQRAPDFAFTDLEGDTITLASLRGKPVLLDFWATWCGPCRRSLPHIEELARRHEKDGLVVLAVTSEAPAKVREFLRKNPLEVRVAFDTGATAHEKYHVSSIPAGFLIDRKGTIAAQYVGYTPRARLERLLERVGIGRKQTNEQAAD